MSLRFCPFKIDPIVVETDRFGTDSGPMRDDEAIDCSLLIFLRIFDLSFYER